ncbi:hypothetical protein [Stenotrophomonas sp. YAU14D1_LEIMI4_1]|uniref:hypothetical protein n=1 Tax=Stenotrophomonas sp. YAU14D1_LEIMI4_1 TaxID=2072407 RepID=UPI000D53F532|nr:hypothetical protein [Stenotrophomonas sp. YAU14D1_LEIMI4_1]AWH26373.1 hypothetical protein C1932_15360 [Stenotrophomonas sp. YAU14D1_LEIMI4_1]
MKHPLMVALLVSGLALGFSAYAKEAVLQAGQPLLPQLDKIDKDLNDGETYSELSAQDRGRVRETLVRLRRVGEEYRDGASMPESVRTQVFNDQETVNVVLTQAREDSRLICRREKTTGSNRATTQCLTAAQRERMRDDADRNLTRAQRGGPTKNN